MPLAGIFHARTALPADFSPGNAGVSPTCLSEGHLNLAGETPALPGGKGQTRSSLQICDTKHAICGLTLRLGWIAAAGLAARLSAAEPTAAGIEFFERKVRPLLAENCYACHGEEKQKNHLRLDSTAAIRLGGESGAVIVPE